MEEGRLWGWKTKGHPDLNYELHSWVILLITDTVVLLCYIEQYSPMASCSHCCSKHGRTWCLTPRTPGLSLVMPDILLLDISSPPPSAVQIRVNILWHHSISANTILILMSQSDEHTIRFKDLQGWMLNLFLHQWNLILVLVLLSFFEGYTGSLWGNWEGCNRLCDPSAASDPVAYLSGPVAKLLVYLPLPY